MSKGIKLSPKHGVNPSMDLCFWCGQPKGLILCGRMHEKKGDRTDVFFRILWETGRKPFRTAGTAEAFK